MCKYCTCSDNIKEEIVESTYKELNKPLSPDTYDTYAFSWATNINEYKAQVDKELAKQEADKFKAEHSDIANIWLNKSKKGYFTTIKLKDGRKATVRKAGEDEHNWREAMWWCYVKVLKEPVMRVSCNGAIYLV